MEIPIYLLSEKKVNYKFGDQVLFDPNNDELIDSDYDVFDYDTNELIAKFRKSVINPEVIDTFEENVLHFVKTTYSTQRKRCGFGTSPLRSSIIGFYDRPILKEKYKYKLPCWYARETVFNRDFPDKFNNCLPFFQECDKIQQQLVPDKHKLQLNQALKTPEFIIPNTSYSTCTLNYNYSTNYHTDKGDFKDGFGNLIVIDDDNYTGGYFKIPSYNVCFNVKRGDFLAVNVHVPHATTEIIPIKKDYQRLSVVLYLREKMEVAVNNLVK